MKGIVKNNSRVPVLLSYFSPIEIWAITIWPFIFCRGELGKKMENHEQIHIQQYNDLFLFGLTVVYIWDYLHGMVKYRNDYNGFSSVGEKAYYRTRSEQEAYDNDQNLDYLKNRKKREWLTKYKV